VIEYQIKAFRKNFPSKWFPAVPDFRKHLDFDKFVYRDGHNVYTATCKEVRDKIAVDREQYELWRRLRR